MSTPLELARRIVGAVNFMDNPLMPDAKILAQALIEAAKDTERLDYVISVLERYGSDGLMDRVYTPALKYDREAIDTAKEKA